MLTTQFSCQWGCGIADVNQWQAGLASRAAASDTLLQNGAHTLFVSCPAPEAKRQVRESAKAALDV